MKLATLSLLATVVLTGYGCSNSTHISQTVVEGADLFEVVATPTMQTSHTGVTCVGARGQVWIKDGTVGGVLTDDRQRNFKITGRLKADHSVEAGIAVNSQLVASWGGQIRHNAGHGSWRDESGCQGDWRLSSL